MSSRAQQEAEPGNATDRALAVAYAFVNRRERTVAEVRARLERAGICEAEITAALAELVGHGFLDDARYARVFTQDKRTLEAWGSGRIARALRERGVAGELIEAALAGAETEASAAAGDRRAGAELGRALALLRRRFPTGPSRPGDGQRAYGVLARKGYASEIAADAVREWARRAA